MTIGRGALYRLASHEREAAVRRIRETLSGESDISFAYLFGSFLEAEAFHDIDVGVMFTANRAAPGEGRLQDVALALGGRLEAAVRVPVDVVPLNGRPVTFRFHVYRGELLTVSDEERLSTELEQVIAQYFDLEPVLRRADEGGIRRMTLNPDVVRARCADIEDAVERLRRFAQMPGTEFCANSDAVDAASYRLLVAIEAAVGLCYHVSARHLRKVPEQFAECFQVLGEAGIIEPELATRLQAMARFRNLLVHMYARVDVGRLHEILRNDTGDLSRFASATARLL